MKYTAKCPGFTYNFMFMKTQPWLLRVSSEYATNLKEQHIYDSSSLSSYGDPYEPRWGGHLKPMGQKSSLSKDSSADIITVQRPLLLIHKCISSLYQGRASHRVV